MAQDPETETEVVIQHYLVVNDDGSGSSSYGISTREDRPAECERRAREWIRPGYHLEIHEQTFHVSPSTWRTVATFVKDADGVERKVTFEQEGATDGR